MRVNVKKRALIALICAATALAVIAAAGSALNEAAAAVDFSVKELPPSPEHPFGTDWMGRDMFLRTLSGLSLSIGLGVITAAISALIALALGSLASVGKKTDATVSWFTDLVMGIPHLLLLILISFACGRGFMGVVLGISLTHWPSLSRVLRGEIIQLKQSGFVLIARKLGVKKGRVVRVHMLPHIAPQFTAGLALLFPHAILHEASMTFLGFGLPPDTPAIGVILSESMSYLLMGEWWLGVFPGAMLVAAILLFDLIGTSVKTLYRAG